MSSSRILPRLLILLGCAFVGASLGTVRQALRITNRPQAFRSMAKLVAGGQKDNTLTWRDGGQVDFYVTILETIECAEMKRRTLERVKALNPELKDGDVSIRAVQTKGSGLINILASGPEPKYTRLFLDALLDEVIDFRQYMRDQAQGKVLLLYHQEVNTRENQMEKSLRALEEVRSKVESLSAKTDQERLVTRLNELRNQRDDLNLELKPMAESDPARAPLQTNLRTIEVRILVAESELQRFEPGFSELRMLTEKYEVGKEAYEKLFEMEDRWEAAFKSVPADVYIQERASPASENVEDWRLPVAVGAGGGALLGALIGLVLSLLLVRSPNPPQIPTAL